ncbi:twin-arginine translocase TatA/TatE family subunit [Phenylobacterium sp.]|jgi:sec-independent protein translocase protein TatA|uniref:twin-arginine translocase TatA/TatE family subunit n=1 Tax=Phenylobacterium sp. TaxID=1871053 RepID=UPI0037C8A82F
MGALSIWHILAIVIAAALLFGGRGKISSLMGDTAKGIRAFRDGLKGEDAPEQAKTPLPKDEKDVGRT